MPLYALIVLAAAMSYGYHRLLIGDRDLVEHTYEVITTLESTLARMTDAETGQRGYVITGMEAYLAPYRRAVTDLPDLIAKLRGLVADSPLQTERVALLEQAVESKLAELRQTVATVENGDTEDARRVVTNDVGRVAMDTVRDRIAALRAEEAELLRQRSARARAAEHQLLAVSATCALLSLLARFGLSRWPAKAKRRDEPGAE